MEGTVQKMGLVLGSGDSQKKKIHRKKKKSTQRRWDLNERIVEHTRHRKCPLLVSLQLAGCGFNLNLCTPKPGSSKGPRAVPGSAEDKLTFRMLRVNVLRARLTKKHVFFLSLGA